MASHPTLIIARAHARLGEKYRVEIEAGRHPLVADEGAHLGGSDAGPAPFELLLGALAACTAITLRMYAERKAWPLDGLSIDLAFGRDDDVARIDRAITVEGGLSDEQLVKLAKIAERTPVTLVLKSGVAIRTELHG